jgi:hypothetical protein
MLVIPEALKAALSGANKVIFWVVAKVLARPALLTAAFNNE